MFLFGCVCVRVCVCGVVRACFVYVCVGGGCGYVRVCMCVWFYQYVVLCWCVRVCFFVFEVDVSGMRVRVCLPVFGCVCVGVDAYVVCVCLV